MVTTATHPSKQGGKTQDGLAQAASLRMAFVVQKANGFVQKKKKKNSVHVNFKYFFHFKGICPYAHFPSTTMRGFLGDTLPSSSLSASRFWCGWQLPFDLPVGSDLFYVSAKDEDCSVIPSRWAEERNPVITPSLFLWPSNCESSNLTFKVRDCRGSGYTLAVRQVWPSPTGSPLGAVQPTPPT